MSIELDEPSAPAESPSEMPVDPDLDLLRLFAERADPDAFAEIVRRYAPAVYSAALRVTGDGARAEEVAQETFFRLMVRGHEIERNVGAWLHRTATHLALDALRADGARRHREIVYTRECVQTASTWTATTWAELSPALDQVLTELPEAPRMLLVRHYLLGRTQAELAAETGQSPATVSRRMKQALELVRQRLRLKGIEAMPTVLAGLLCHAAARQAPASLLRELGKMNLLCGAAHTARATASSAGPFKFPRAGIRGGDVRFSRAGSRWSASPIFVAAGILAAAVLVMYLVSSSASHTTAPQRIETPGGMHSG